MWPLNYYFFEEWHLEGMLNGGTLGAFTLGTGLVLIFVISPLLTYRYGKRWYCSWVCGCGALAETAGDPFRQLSSKKMSVWKLERWMVHGVLVFVTLTTLAVLWTLLGSPKNPTGISQWAFSVGAILFFSVVLGAIWFWKRQELDADARYALVGIGLILLGIFCFQAFSNNNNLLGISSYTVRKWYGFGVGAVFSGVLGVGFYPLLGVVSGVGLDVLWPQSSACNNACFLALESPPTEGSVFPVATALPIVKWVLTFVATPKKDKTLFVLPV